MKPKGYLPRAALFGLLIVGIPGAANALVSWTFNTDNCLATVGPAGNCGSGDNNFSDGRIYQGSVGAGNVAVSGWANTTGGNKKLQLGQITHYGGGLGVRNADAGNGDANEGTPPEHAVDNDERFDLVLFDFGDQQVELGQITLGWVENDSDISVLAYTGDLDPTDDTGGDYLGDREAWWNSDTDNNEDLTSHGWSLIGNHDVDNGPAPSNEQDINSGDVASSYWLVSAYNPVFGSNCTPGNSFCQSDHKEYFKILTLAGDIIPPTGNSVPAPSTALLLAAGLLAFGRKSSGRG